MISSLSVKRLALFSPETHSRQVKKRNSVDVDCKKTLSFEKAKNSDTKPLKELCTESMSVFDKSYDSLVTNSFSEEEMWSLNQALSTRQPLAFVNVLSRIPRATLAFKRVLVENVNKNAQQLCKRKSGSVLRDSSFEILEKFHFEDIWQEMVKNQPFLVDMLNAVTGKHVNHMLTTDAVKIKLSQIYSILMFSRWNELSLLQRLNTVLIIEGGCSKQVLLFIILYSIYLSNNKLSFRRDFFLHCIKTNFFLTNEIYSSYKD